MATKTLTYLTFSRILRKNFARSFSATAGAHFEYIKTEITGAKENVGVITLNQTEVLNTLSNKLLIELTDALNSFDANRNIGAIVITGNEKFFAAGVDLKEILNSTYSDYIIKEKYLTNFDKISYISKPTIAAVNGYALGGGCALAMICDFIYAGETATFGLPEILLGTIPGAGGTQRLVKSVGKSKAMEMVLTGNPVKAHEAEKMGLISKVFPPDRVLHEAIKTAEKIASFSQIIVKIAKEAVNTAYETTLQEGTKFEKRMSNSTFATEDLKEGMKAFIEKRAPIFTHK